MLIENGLQEKELAQVRAYIEDPSSYPNGVGLDATGRRKDGSVFPMHVTVGAVQLPDRRILVAILRDITEYVQIHEKLARAEHLAGIGEMGASVAHEIRNPLTGIEGALHLVGDSLHENDLKRDIVQEALTQVRRVERTVSDLLMFARPWKPEKRACNIRETIEAARADIERQETFAGIDFEIQVDEAMVAYVDPALLQQVLVNVFRNAAQAMPAGGRITVTAMQTAGTTQIAIEDTGEGIPDKLIEKVFRPFFTTRTRGSGLGLPVCRRIMESQNGAILLTSVPGKGTKVTLELPTGD